MKRFSRYFLIAFDILLVIAAYALCLCFVDKNNPNIFEVKILLTLGSICAIHLFLFKIFGLYRIDWRHAGASNIFKVVLIMFLAYEFSNIFAHLFSVRVGFFNLFLAYLLATLAMFTDKAALIYAKDFLSWKTSKGGKRTLIIGAGSAGRFLVEEMSDNDTEFYPVCIIDDDPLKTGTKVYSTLVVGTTSVIEKVCREKDISTIFYAIPSSTAKEKKRIFDICSNTGCKVYTLPELRFLQNSSGKMLRQMKSVEPTDILEREPINLDNTGLRNFLDGKVCLVTGGGGSIGSELCRQISHSNPKKLVILDINENNCFNIHQEILYEGKPDYDLHIEIATVRDFAKLEVLFEKYRPDLIIHAAAHKHVPYMEENPEEAVKNNIEGTYNVAKLAVKYGTEKFILVSTDKAVNTTNMMGASKRCCELIMQYFAAQGVPTCFAAVRFGNVLGSAGSVLPLFKSQIEKGGPVTLTHEDITRYFMTIPEASSLILQAAIFASSGEIYILDMGKPVKIIDLAKKTISLSGLVPEKDIQIQITGLRPGEKLYEELFFDQKSVTKTENDKIFIESQKKAVLTNLDKDLQKLIDIANTNDKQALTEQMQMIQRVYNNNPHILLGDQQQTNVI